VGFLVFWGVKKKDFFEIFGGKNRF
jgi:hypothetical protein